MKYTVLVFFLLFGQGLMAQYMKHAIGVRGGVSNGVSYQFFYQEDRAAGALLSFRDNGLQLTAMLICMEPLRLHGADQFFVYYGAGLHAGFTRNQSFLWYLGGRNEGEDPHTSMRPVIGADGVLGIEYQIYTIPISFAVDYKPFFELFGHRIFRLSMGDLAFTLKYRF